MLNCTLCQRGMVATGLCDFDHSPLWIQGVLEVEPAVEMLPQYCQPSNPLLLLFHI